MIRLVYYVEICDIILDPLCILSLFMTVVTEKVQPSPEGVINDIDLLIDDREHVHESLSHVQ